ncbi:GNAT family N-acetyltransferase [Rhodococcus zopfii]|uniref:GNAT family N-acetyltransferase n=1 Tax=Rhodococcus zopfii TaxID=43772 RepID=UPI00111139F9|nr:GNAT family N-acetyltransferase [Rhodococcus zopfii]
MTTSIHGVRDYAELASDNRIRTLHGERELTRALDLFRTAMVGLPFSGPLPPGVISRILEPGRTLGAFDGADLVGTVDAASSSLTLPGGRVVPHAAVTHIGVLPTHTRRGIVSGLIRHQLRDARERGEVVASLRASEATIYERFGYGVASDAVSAELNTRRAVLRPQVPVGDPVRLVDPGTAWALLSHIHSENRPGRAGSIDRPDVWWAFQEARAATASGPRYVAVHGEPGAETGFVRYHPIDTEHWFTGENRTIVVDDLFAPTDTAYTGLIRFLLSLDLVERIVFTSLPVDTPLPWLVTDHRAVRILGRRDETWLRILDTESALRLRNYTGTGSVTLTVHDEILTESTGTFRISAAGAEPAQGKADLELGVAALGSLLLGGVRWHQLALSGAIRVTDPTALTIADRLFSTDRAPFAGTSF